MQNNAFQPFGPTVLVDAANPVQAPTNTGTQATSYRIRNVANAAAYIIWSPAVASAQQPTMGFAAPVQQNPAENTIGMLANSVETFVLPQNCWFLASAGTFEVTPGEGI